MSKSQAKTRKKTRPTRPAGAQLGARGPAFAAAATGGKLLPRIRRLLGAEMPGPLSLGRCLSGVLALVTIIAIGVAVGVSCSLAEPSAELANAPARQAAEKAEKERISALIEQLGSSKFEERRAAQQALVKIGPSALPALRAASQGDDAERAIRAKQALESIQRYERIPETVSQVLLKTHTLGKRAPIASPPGLGAEEFLEDIATDGRIAELLQIAAKGSSAERSRLKEAVIAAISKYVDDLPETIGPDEPWRPNARQAPGVFVCAYLLSSSDEQPAEMLDLLTQVLLRYQTALAANLKGRLKDFAGSQDGLLLALACCHYLDVCAGGRAMTPALNAGQAKALKDYAAVKDKAAGRGHPAENEQVAVFRAAVEFALAGGNQKVRKLHDGWLAATKPGRQAADNDIAWGNATNGLQAGLRFGFQNRAYHMGEQVGFTLLVRNTGDKAVRVEDTIEMIGWAPNIRGLGGSRVWVNVPRWSGPVQGRNSILKPGDNLEVGTIHLQLDASPKTPGQGLGPHVHLTPGTYVISQTYRFRDSKEATWSGVLTTGELVLTVVTAEARSDNRVPATQPAPSASSGQAANVAGTQPAPATGSGPAPAAGSGQAGNGAANKARAVRRVYDVRDLVIAIPSYTVQPAYWDGIDGNMGFLRGTEPGSAESRALQKKTIERQNLAELIEKIKRIDPGSWLPEAGIESILLYRDGEALVISQTPENHARISKFIELLRGERSLQVLISFKFIHWSGSQAAGKSDALPDWLSKNAKATFDEKTGLLRLSDSEAEALLEHVRKADYGLLASPRITLCNRQRAYVTIGSYEAIFLPRLDKKGEKALMRIPTGAVVDIKTVVDRKGKSIVCNLATWLAERAFQGDVPGVAVAEAKAAFIVPDKGTMLFRVELVKHKIEGARQAAGPDGAAKMEVRHSPVETGKQEKDFTYILISPQIIEPATQPAPATMPADAPMHMPSAPNGAGTQPAPLTGSGQTPNGAATQPATSVRAEAQGKPPTKYVCHQVAVWTFDKKTHAMVGFAKGEVAPGGWAVLESVKGHAITFTLGQVKKVQVSDEPGGKRRLEPMMEFTMAHGTGSSQGILALDEPKFSVEYGLGEPVASVVAMIPIGSLPAKAAGAIPTRLNVPGQPEELDDVLLGSASVGLLSVREAVEVYGIAGRTTRPRQWRQIMAEKDADIATVGSAVLARVGDDAGTRQFCELCLQSRGNEQVCLVEHIPQMPPSAAMLDAMVQLITADRTYVEQWGPDVGVADMDRRIGLLEALFAKYTPRQVKPHAPRLIAWAKGRKDAALPRKIEQFVNAPVPATQPATRTAKENPLLMTSRWPKEKALPGIRITDRSDDPLLKPDRPWEDFTLGYCRVVHEGDIWHMWYLSYDQNYRNDSDCYMCYAQSKDGLRWEKPDLGLFEYRGSRKNNILAFGVCGASVFLDGGAAAGERFKIVYNKLVGGKWWVYGGTSADGIRWKWLNAPLLKKNSDTDNVCFSDGGLYRLYVRMWTGGAYAGRRIVGYTEARTFGGFPEPVAILQPDENDPPDLHLYNSAAAKLADGLYIMFPSAFHTSTGTVCPLVALSRDGKQFDRVGRTAILPPGKGFDSKCIYVGSGAIPADKAGEYLFYYFGTDIEHDATRPGKVKSAGGIGRFRLALSEDAATQPAVAEASPQATQPGD